MVTTEYLQAASTEYDRIQKLQAFTDEELKMPLEKVQVAVTSSYSLTQQGHFSHPNHPLKSQG